jgi:hypothetical protein
MGGKAIRIYFDIPDRLIQPFVWLALLYRRIRYGYTFRRIPLTQGKYAIVDPEDYERLSKHKWYAIKSPNTYYAGRHSKRDKNNKRRYIKMHNEVIKPPKGLINDHINRNGLDNRKANLRPVTRAQNTLNRLYKFKRKDSPSKYKGVTWHKYTKKWQVQICYAGKHKFVGYFDDEIEAAKAYNEAAKLYHKEFAVLNFKK